MKVQFDFAIDNSAQSFDQTFGFVVSLADSDHLFQWRAG